MLEEIRRSLSGVTDSSDVNLISDASVSLGARRSVGYSRILSQEDPEVGRLSNECFVLAGLGTSNRGG